MKKTDIAYKEEAEAQYNSVMKYNDYARRTIKNKEDWIAKYIANAKRMDLKRIEDKKEIFVGERISIAFLISMFALIVYGIFGA